MKTRIVSIAFLMSCLTASAFAQATRTWVSGVGDDANPCSRTAPCKTFAGAISKTASGGIIDALDPGGFGAVTITKPITIEGNGTLASVLASGTQGIIVNITSGTNRDVVLRNLLIDGSGTTLGTNGINFIAGDSLTVEECYIKSFSTTGILFQPNSNAKLAVKNSSILLTTTGIRTTSATGGVTAFSDLYRSVIDKNGTGILADQASKMVIRECSVSNNSGDGVSATSTGASQVTVDFSTVANNNIALHSNGGNTELRVNNSTITGNSNPTSSTNSGALCTYTSNRIAQNGAVAAFTCTGTNQ